MGGKYHKIYFYNYVYDLSTRRPSIGADNIWNHFQVVDSYLSEWHYRINTSIHLANVITLAPCEKNEPSELVNKGRAENKDGAESSIFIRI